MPGHALDVGSEARRFVEAHGLEDRVRFAGPTDDPVPYLSAADVFVLPSHYEAFGLAALEAMSCGVPVVASDVGGLRDFVRPGQTGVLVPPHDAASLAGALDSLLMDEARRGILGRQARDLVEAEFSEEVIGARYVELLTRLTARS
jgi:glycosyltransferase involved in cell wall biosynthesis